MPTLDELLGLNIDPSVIQTRKLENYFSTNIEPQIEPQVQGGITPLTPTAIAPEDPSMSRGALNWMATRLWETTGLPLYSFADTAAFGIPGLAIKKTLGEEFEEKYLAPKTAVGKVGSAIGGTVGFVYGAPMKLGIRATAALARPVIRGIGKKTVKEVTKKATQEAVKGSHLKQFGGDKVKFIEETFGKTVGGLSHQSRWGEVGKAVNKNWVRTSSKAIDEVAESAVKNGNLTVKEAELVVGSFKKNLTSRPLQDIVDVVMQRYPNKFGFITGSMIQEGIMFGMIDAAMEGVHALKEERPYDWSAPLWGIGVGGAFGALKLLPAAGKASITSQDFKGGVKALFSKNYFANMGDGKLIKNAKIIGESKVLNEGAEASVIQYKDHVIDLLNPIASIGLGKKKGATVLRAALIDQQKYYGKEMMKAAASEDFKSTLANWKRVIAGTGIMNIRTTFDIAAGHEMDPVDVMTSLMIGAFINRKGAPLTPDMNMAKMQKIRRNLDILGVPQTRLYEINAMQVPTMHRSGYEHINPLSDKAFEGVRNLARKEGVLSKTPEGAEVSNMEATNSPSLAVSQKSFPLFNRFYEWIHATSPGEYIKPKALITEAEALRIEKSIKEINFENTGKKIKSIDDFDEVMLLAKNKMTDNLEYSLGKTTKDIIEDTTWGTVGPPLDLRTIPQHYQINSNLKQMLRAGKIDGLTEKQALTYLRKAQMALDVIANTTIGQKTTDPNLLVAEIATEGQLRRLIDHVNLGEGNVRELFGPKRKGSEFKFEDLPDLLLPLMKRRFDKGVENYEMFFDDMKNPNWNSEVIPQLLKLGAIKPDPEDVTRFRRLEFQNMTFEHPEGYKGGNEEILMKTVMGILSAKGNESLRNVDTRSKVTISADQVQEFSSFLSNNKIITDKNLLETFRNNIVQQIHSKVVKEADVRESDVQILNELAGLAIPMARYSTLSDGGTGFSISKIDIAAISGVDKRTRLYKNVINYNEYVDGLVKRATVKKTGKQFIASDRTIKFRDPLDVSVVNDIVNRSRAGAQKNASRTLVEFVQTLDPSSTLHHSLIHYMETTKSPDRLLNFLQGEGLITPQTKKGTIEYHINRDLLDRSDMKLKIEEFLGKFGVHTSDIQKMKDVADAELNSALHSNSKESGNSLSQQDFILKYYSDKNGKGRFSEAESQNRLFEDAISAKDPHKYLIEKMDFERDGKSISGADILKKRKVDESLYREALDDVQKMITLRNGSISVKKISVHNSQPKETIEVMQKTPLTEFLKETNTPFVFVDGDIYTQYFADRKVRTNRMNVFDLDSPHNDHSYNNPTVSKEIKDNFMKTIKKYSFDTGLGGKNSPQIKDDVRFIRMGNGKDVLAVPGSQHSEILALFKKEIYDPFISKKVATGESFRKIQNIYENMQKLEQWSDFHEDAMRSIIVNRMVKGKGDETRFLRVLEGKDIAFSEIGKRFSLFHTPSFKRIDLDIVKSLKNKTSGGDKDILKEFSERELGMIVWNDDNMATVFSRNKEYFKRKEEGIREMLGNRSDVSGFDSITFISAKFKRFLELYYGISAEGSNVFKPVITSGGKNHLFSAKTVFVHDPDIELDIFSKHKGLDILTTRSADKMKSAISDAEWAGLPKGKNDRIRYIDKSIDDMLKIDGKTISEYIVPIDLKSVGVTIMPDKAMLAKQSYSLTNFYNATEVGEYFDTFYKNPLEKLIGSSSVGEGIMQKIVQNSMYKRLALIKLKQGDLKTNLEDLMSSPESMQNLGHHIQVAAMGGDPRMLGEHVLHNAVKSKFIDPILSPKSQTPEGEIYGGKAVIKQSFKFRNLKPTIRTNEGKDTKINQGDIMLPFNARSGSIDFKKADLQLRAVGKNGEVRPLKEVLMKIWQEKVDKHGAKLSPEANWEWLMTNGDLGRVYDTLVRNTKDWDLGIVTTRYPRTAPNDQAVLRLKGFLGRKHGNTAIVNDFDVMNIFEGDYDVDEVDFFWGMNRRGWKHIDRVKHHWVNTKDPSHYEPKAPDLDLLTGKNNQDWNTFDANNRVFKRGIGIVQKTPRLLNHLEMIGVKDKTKGSQTEGMTQLLSYKTLTGEKVEVFMDYDNSNFFQRSALESQLLIDYWKGVNKNIVTGMVDYRNDYLFPSYNESIANKDIKSLKQRQQDHSLKGPNNKRVRLFRKYVNGKESQKNELTKEEKQVIKELMSQNSKFLNLTREVYDNSGMGRNPGYEDLYSVSQSYFNGHLKDIRKNAFLSVYRKFGVTENVREMFNPTSVNRAYTNNKLKYYSKKKNDDAVNRLEKMIALENQNKRSGEHTYMWHTRNPFLEGMRNNAENIAKQDGSNGSIMERVYREIYFKDPFGNERANSKVDIPLKGDLYVELQAVSSELLNKHYRFDNVQQIRDIVPKLTKDFNEDVKMITSLNRLKDQIQYSKELTQKQKNKRIEGIEKAIQDREAVMKDLLPKEYLKTRRPKDLEKLKILDITNDQEIIEGTVQWYTLDPLADKFSSKDKGGFSKLMNETLALGAELYTERTSLGSSSPYRGKTILSPKQEKLRVSPKEEFVDIEAEIYKKLEQGFNEFNMPFLINYALPRKTETTIGLFKGIAMPVSSKASGRLKRVTKFLLDKMNTTKDPQERLAIKETLESLIGRYTAYRNFFDGNFDLIPTADRDMMHLYNNAPGFSSNIKSTFDRYESIKIEKGIFARDVFGMGPEYDNNVAFYQRMLNAGIGDPNTAAFREVTEVLSKTNQLAMENGYLDPISYFLHTKGIRNRLDALGLGDVEQVQIIGNKLDNLNIHSRESGLAILGGKTDGITIKPMAMLSDYRLSLLRTFITQGKDVKNNLKNSDKDWKRLRQEEEMAGYCKPNNKY